MNEAGVKKKVEAYFTNTFQRFSVSQECVISFGSRQGGFADVVLHTDEHFVVIAECKRWPLPIPHDRAKAQLESYMSATNTRYGVLAVGTDPRHWEFFENKYHNRFVPINRETFERSVENWEPISVETLEVNLQRERKTARWWKRIALAFALAFLICCVSVFLLWRKLPPEPVVYITRTGRKYHTYNCNFLKQYADGKFAIYLDEAEKNYDPCRICSPHRIEKSR